jgi:uncharacterized integral membrane protein
MARKLFTIFVLAPLALVFVVFAVANRQSVTVSFDPFDSTQPAFSLTMPLFVLILILLMLGIIIGGVASWAGQGRWRRTARHLDADVRDLRSEVDGLRRQTAVEPRGLPRPAADSRPNAPLRAPVH